MAVILKWSRTAQAQYRALSPAQQESANNAVRAIGLSPDAGDVYQHIQTAGGTVEKVYALFGLRVVVLYRKAWIGGDLEVKIRGVFPSNLRSLTEYEEDEEARRSRPPHRGRGQQGGPEDW